MNDLAYAFCAALKKSGGGPDTLNRRLLLTVRGRRQTVRVMACRG